MSMAPTHDVFAKVWDLAHKGALPELEAGIGCRRKMAKMLYCIGEAIKEKDKTFLRTCTGMTIHRDASDGILLVRFQACRP